MTTSDFVIASRRLGVDHTTDRFRQAGVKLYAWILNEISHQDLTDSSNGYRAFKIELLNDIAPHLIQDQYQTAEVVITASSRGWRITQQPTVWHPRASGTSKKGGNLFFGLHYGRVIGYHLAPGHEGEPARGGRDRVRRPGSVPAGDGDRAVVEVLDGVGQLLGELVDAAPRDAAPAGAGRRGDGLTHHQMDVSGPRQPLPLGHHRGRAADPDRDHRGPGAGGQEGHPFVQVLHHRSRPPFPFGEQDEHLPGLQHLLGPAQGLPVGRLPVDREGTHGGEDAGQPAGSSTGCPWPCSAASGR